MNDDKNWNEILNWHVTMKARVMVRNILPTKQVRVREIPISYHDLHKDGNMNVRNGPFYIEKRSANIFLPNDRPINVSHQSRYPF